MSTVTLSKPEILARLVEIHSFHRELYVEETELLARLQRPKGNTVRPVELTFGKDMILWGQGQVLAIKGKGYRFIKALYYADGMRLKEATLDKQIWKGKVTHRTFTRYIHRLAEKLEKAKFPYRLQPIESKPKVKTNGKFRHNKPDLHFVPPEIIGARLYATDIWSNVAGN
jgi:hypothetical protein